MPAAKNKDFLAAIRARALLDVTRMTGIRNNLLALSCIPLALALGCTTGDRVRDGDGTNDAGMASDGAVPETDAGHTDTRAGRDAGTPRDATLELDSCDPHRCSSTESCGGDGEGNGLDDDCDGQVDEGCTCAYGVARSCFDGAPSLRGVGRCTDGVMTCDEFLQWGECSGGHSPVDELCNGADDDCDGSTDESLAGCETSLACPETESAAPLSAYRLRGGSLYSGSGSWRWSIECPPEVTHCPVPTSPTARDTEVFFVTSGSYRVRAEVTTPEGTLSCEWIVRVQGSGLRVELTWAQGGMGEAADLDLHLHRQSAAPGSGSSETGFNTNDDCYWANCRARNYRDEMGERWGLPDTTDVSACDDAPHGAGALWSELGACHNPRLDIDVTICDPEETDRSSAWFCAPENVNVDAPPEGQPYRIMVHRYASQGFGGTTTPQVAVYCNGELRGSFGRDGSVRFTAGGPGTWYVADVVFETDECGIQRCRIQPLDEMGSGLGFGPPWSF